MSIVKKVKPTFHLDLKGSQFTPKSPPFNDSLTTPAQTLRSTSNEESLDMSFQDTQWTAEDSKDHMFDQNQDWQGTFDTAGFGLDQWGQPTPAFEHGSLDLSVAHDNMSLGLENSGMPLGMDAIMSRNMTNNVFHNTQPQTLKMEDFMANHQYQQPMLYNPQEPFAHVQLPNHSNMHYPMQHYKNPNNQVMGMHNQSISQRPEMEGFRFHVALQTGTAFTKCDEETPVTYLNKSQAYKIRMRDVMPQCNAGPVTYRTYIRISFEEDKERRNPTDCWKLWKEGRGMLEAHHRGGKLQAVEYVPATQGQSMHRPSNVEVQSESFDGFCINWTPNYNSHDRSSDCEVSVKFNFLSTDFSHSKGVKGIPIRLCAKTEVVNPMGGANMASEVSYCLVKLFRDHGAERKISNDEQHIKKNIAKLDAQLGQSQSADAVNSNGKRRRSDAASAARPSKLARKHTHRASSISSSSSTGNHDAAEDDINGKLAELEYKLNSRKSESALYLRGDCGDDPDESPITLPGVAGVIMTEESPAVPKPQRTATLQSQPSMDSPTPSSIDFASPSRRTSALYTLPGPAPNKTPSQTQALESSTVRSVKSENTTNTQNLITPPSDVTRVKSLDTWINASGVDHTFQPPTVQKKAIASFFIHDKATNNASDSPIYDALYLHSLTLQAFVSGIARIYKVDATAITTVLRVNDNGITIKVDDDTVAQMPEGQAMITELDRVDHSPFRKLTLRF